MADLSILLFKVPQNNQVKEDASSDFFSQLAEIVKGKNIMLSAEIIIYNKFFWFILACPKNIREIIEGLWFSHYPQAEVDEIKDFTQSLLQSYSSKHIVGCELYYEQSDLLPLKTYKEIKKNPLVSLSGIANSFTNDELGIIQLVLQSPSKDNVWTKILKRMRDSSRKKYIEEIGEKADYIKLEEQKESNPYFRASIHYLVSSNNRERSSLHLSSIVSAYKTNLERPKIQKLKEEMVKIDGRFIEHFINRLPGKHQFRFSTDELATIFHAPYEKEGIFQVVQTKSKRAAPPQNIPSKNSSTQGDIAYFGETNFQGEKTVFGIKTEDRRRHLYVVGKTGMGKSKLIDLLIKSDLEHRHGIILLDPHGDLSQDVLSQVPENRKNDVVYLNPADSDYPVGFNPMEGVSTFEFKQNVVAGFISIFKKLFSFNWNERLEHVLRYTTLALLDYPVSNVLGITRMLADSEFRQRVIKYISDPLVKKFWTTEFASWNEQFAQQAIVPIINNVGQFIANPVIRNIVGQAKTGFSLDEILNKGKILIANLSIGKLGEENSALLGSMLITKIWQAALARASLGEEKRRDVFLYVDEFQNFATTAFANIFSEARKYRLNLTVSHQYMQQLPTEVRSTIFGNVGSIISFRVGGEDAQILVKEFEPVFTSADFLNLDSRNFYSKMSIDGTTAKPFSGRTISIEKSDINNTAEIIEASRRKYAKTKKAVEREIEQWEKGEIEIKKEEIKEESFFPEPIV